VTGEQATPFLTHRGGGRFVLAAAPLCIALLAATLTLAAALGLPSLALAAGAPEGLDDMVTMIARTEATGPVAWARYAATSADAAAGLLGETRDQLSEGTPDRVYLVVMRGDFSMQDMGQGSGPYLAFLYWRSGDTWNASDFTVMQRPVPLRSVGAPQAVDPFLLAHPTLNRALPHVVAGLFWFLPAILLALCAALCAWQRRSTWAYVLAACVAAAVAAWQTYILLHSMSGHSWDPVFHGIKLGMLAVVVGVDLAAVCVLLRSRSRLEAAGRARAGRPAWLHSGVLLLVVAAALSIASYPWLASTGE
jgi:hypothetical protein